MSITITIKSCIKGYHVYKVRPAIGEEVVIRLEPDNPYDRMCQAIFTKDGKKVGHAPAAPYYINYVLHLAFEYNENTPVKW